MFDAATRRAREVVSLLDDDGSTARGTRATPHLDAATGREAPRLARI